MNRALQWLLCGSNAERAVFVAVTLLHAAACVRWIQGLRRGAW